MLDIFSQIITLLRSDSSQSPCCIVNPSIARSESVSNMFPSLSPFLNRRGENLKVALVGPHIPRLEKPT